MRKLILIGLSALLLAACTKQSLQSTYDKQTSYIESFVSTQMGKDATATLTRNGGAYRLNLQDTLDPTRDSLAWGQRVSLRYACFTLTSASLSASNLVATNRPDGRSLTRAASSWTPSRWTVRWSRDWPTDWWAYSLRTSAISCLPGNMVTGKTAWARFLQRVPWPITF